jgi:hypothetical protein
MPAFVNPSQEVTVAAVRRIGFGVYSDDEVGQKFIRASTST